MSGRTSSRSVLPSLVKLGVFAVITVALTSLLGQTLGSLGHDGTSYRAEFTDVTGLLPGDDVRIAGVRVGKVSDIELVRTKVARVTFTVDGAVPVPAAARARIRYRNLIGQRYLDLTRGPAGQHRRLPAGGLIPMAHTTPALDLTVLFDGFQPLFEGLSPKQVNKFSYEIIRVLQGEGGTVGDLLSRTSSLTNTLADRDKVIGRVIHNLNKVLATLNARDRKLSDIIESLQDFVSGLAADRKDIGRAVDNLGDLTDTTADLVHDGRPALADDIKHLRSLSKTLNANRTVISGTLARLPVRTAALTRTASYGSWFNFYMCNFDGKVNVPGVGGVNPVTVNATAARCRQSGTGGEGR